VIGGEAMSYGSRLFYSRKLYDLEKTDALFIKAVVENLRRHQARCPEYAAILTRQRFHIEDIKTITDIENIPPIPTLFLKDHPMYSAPPHRLMFKSTTSGTSGKVSEMGLDWPSALRGLGMILRTMTAHRLLSPRPTNFVVLGYEPSKRNKIGAAKTAYAVTYTAPAVHRVYALKDTGTSYLLNIDGLRDALLRFGKQGLPVRFMGFPAYFMFLLRELLASGIRLKLHPKSLVILAGGWKQYFSERVEKRELYAMSKETLGLGEDRIREFFGAVEHPIAYFDCPHHHFHIPVYSRVIIRGTDMRPLRYGEPGLLNLITPMMTSMPFTSVMTDDVAVLHPGGDCPCGIKSPYFEVLGRAGLADIKTCAAGAAELLNARERAGAAT
jgi:phenylacetate-coenzyme A ligase PaaK-like adenylate-forming protein